MIEFHVIVNRSNADDIIERVSAGLFELRGSYSTRNGNGRLFVIAAEEDEMIALRLKYGNDNVWKR